MRKQVSSFRITRIFREFTQNEKAGAVLLGACTVLSLLLANSAWGETYRHFWHQTVPVGLHLSVEAWINDGLMALFFLLVGIEIRRELLVGELSSRQNALLPFFGAIGGVVVPIIIHRSLNAGTPTEAGACIPMATDIAFAIAILSILGDRIPASLRVFLTALAIIDDLMAIVVIAVFYNTGIQFVYLGLALGAWAALFGFRRLGIRHPGWYLAPGVLIWYLMHHSGVHATISGVMLAFALPFYPDQNNCTSRRLEHWLMKPVSFGIMPLFALANTALLIQSDWYHSLGSNNALGIIIGLAAGKMIGISGASLLSARLKWASIPKIWGFRRLLGAGMLGGIGFTMSIFISLLAFPEHPEWVESSKMAILVASSVSALLGYLILTGIRGERRPQVSDETDV